MTIGDPAEMVGTMLLKNAPVLLGEQLAHVMSAEGGLVTFSKHTSQVTVWSWKGTEANMPP